MVFSSITFLYFFLPLTLALYFIFPPKARNYVLLVMSVVFYAWGEPKYVVLLVLQTLAGWGFGLLIDYGKTAVIRRFWLVVCTAFSLAGLLYFKYADFIIANVNLLPRVDIPLLKLVLPVGISFYTFQILSYDIDLYRRHVRVQRNPLTFAAYVSLFPQLIAGPIVRYSDIEGELSAREHTLSGFARGVRRFTAGLAKKVLIANILSEFVIISGGLNTVSAAWAYVIAYGLHIYFDFSGYSDMAIGLGRMFGFSFAENFDYPFISRSITEFWRRWHISLSGWFRDYIYIPLGGNRKGLARQAFNIMVVWFLTGFWHGAGWNFIIWGIYFGLLLMFEKFVLDKPLKKMPSIIRHIYVIMLVLISWTIFGGESGAETAARLGAMLGAGTDGFADAETLYYLRSYAVPVIIAVIGATPIPKRLFSRVEHMGIFNVLQPAAVTILLVTSTACITDGSFNPFIYFRF